MTQIIVEKNENGLGTILLDRPKALNALNYEMISDMKETLEKWQKDDTVKVILFSSTTEKALCAGGDMKSMYEAKIAGADLEEINKFFPHEYSFDELVHHYEKPIVANLNGIVMGGGVGFSYGADYKIVTETTMWAMPEMKISFFPDVAASYFLNKAPGKVGRYAALTSESFNAADVLFMNAANVYVKSEQLPSLFTKLNKTNWYETNIEETLHSIMEEFHSTPDVKSNLEENFTKINEHFSYDTIEEIFASLEKDNSKFSQQTLTILRSLSPLSLKVGLELMKRGETMTVSESFQMDLVVARRFLDMDDFYEGVRSVLVDKDRKPNYYYKSITEVPNDLVSTFFEK
jgi:enoyl-CoA hydratase/carnithine racemase